MKHDEAYQKFKDLPTRHKHDLELAERAWDRFKAPDASRGEKFWAWLTTAAMKSKVQMGLGIKTTGTKKSGKGLKKKKNGRKKHTRRVGGACSFARLVSKAKAAIKKAKKKTLPGVIGVAMKALENQTFKGKLPRVIPIVKTGGFIPLATVFAGLSALGAISSGAASIANAVKGAQNAKKQLEEKKRHNEMMEAIALGKNKITGSGMYLKPYKKGFGLFLNPPKNC